MESILSTRVYSQPHTVNQVSAMEEAHAGVVAEGERVAAEAAVAHAEAVAAMEEAHAAAVHSAPPSLAMSE